MGGDKVKTQGTLPPPDRGHPLPRRTSPEKSITLRNHRLSRDASARAAQRALGGLPPATLSRRNSSGDSNETAQSDPKTWFEQSNENPTATYDTTSMDVDPPFFQRETDSSNEDLRGLDVPVKVSGYPYGQGARQPPILRCRTTQSSSADDFRSVIDDLTIENKRLKEELKRLKRFGPNVVGTDKLFEIKVHGLPKRKKRELEATLLNFAASLEGSTEASSQRQKSSRRDKLVQSSAASMSKHASSSSSHSRPVDSAYASMSTGTGPAGPKSSALSLHRPSMLSRTKSSELKVQNYLQDIPEGLYPRPVIVTDTEKKKLVVKRLEQLFTGKIKGRNKHHNQSMPDLTSKENPTRNEPAAMAPPQSVEPAREARIQPQEISRWKLKSSDNLSASNSNGDQTESGGNGNGSGSGSGRGCGGVNNNNSPSTGPPPEQRPTRPRDLDPDRVQIPSENMNYIRHLGLVPPELLMGSSVKHQDVAPDADGWVYLNLLGNLAQLHMINVSPDFIRAAVSEKSTKFQLSADGRKVRWRGGTDGTTFSSDSGGDNSQNSPFSDDTDGSNETGQKKKAKTQGTSEFSSKKRSKFGPQASGSLDSFHYKPLFVHQSSPLGTSLDDTGSSHGQVEESNHAVSRWNYSGSGSSPHRKRRRDGGAIVYYSGAPFCTDLSRDLGDISPTTYMTSTGQQLTSPGREDVVRPTSERTDSSLSFPLRPLREVGLARLQDADSMTPPDLFMDDADSQSDDDHDLPWSDAPYDVHTKPIEPPLEPCGIGGVIPEDHFAVVVTTRRPILDVKARSQQKDKGRRRERLDEMTDTIAHRLAILTTSSPMPSAIVSRSSTPDIEIEYLSAKIRRFKPVTLPPPSSFFPPFSSDSSSEDGTDEFESESEDAINLKPTEPLVSAPVHPHSSNAHPDGEDLASSDEEDEADMETDGYDASGGSDAEMRGKIRARERRVSSRSARRRQGDVHPDSSAATAGGAESGGKSCSGC